MAKNHIVLGVSAKKQERKGDCFIITPIGQESSTIRNLTDRITERVLEPVLTELGYAVVLPHKIPGSGTISIQIINHLINDPMVVANLTTLNPNVMYELGIRHSFGLPAVAVCDKGKTAPQLLPFDVSHQRVIFFEDAIGADEQLRKDLKEYVLAAEAKADKPDNPVFTAVQRKAISESNEIPDYVKLILDKLDELKAVKTMPWTFGGVTDWPTNAIPYGNIFHVSTPMLEPETFALRGPTERCIAALGNLGDAFWINGIRVAHGVWYVSLSDSATKDALAMACLAAGVACERVVFPNAEEGEPPPEKSPV